jgi:hypothetical protein
MPSAAKRLARLIAMVVLPEPPFGFTTSVVFISLFLSVIPKHYDAIMMLRIKMKSKWGSRLRGNDDLGTATAGPEWSS